MLKNISILGLVFSSIIPLTVANASYAPNTRQSSDYLFIKDNGNTISAYEKTGISGFTGVSDVSELNRPISTSKLRTTSSRVNCPDPYNSYKNTTQDIFPSKEWAKKWYGNCILSDYLEIEKDMAHALRETGARRAIYQYHKEVKVRQDGSPVNEDLTYTIILDKNTPPGQGSKSGFSFVQDLTEKYSNLYVKYINPSATKLVDQLISGVDTHLFETHNPPGWAGNGILHVYKMDGLSPEDSNLELVETVESPSFETEVIIEKGKLSGSAVSGLDYDPSGVISVLEYSGNAMSETGSDFMIVDYGNPLDLQDYMLPDETYKYNLLIDMKRDNFLADRTYDRDQCTNSPVVYKQYQKIDFALEHTRERYFVKDPLTLSDLTPSKLVNLDKVLDTELYELQNEEQEDVVKNITKSYSRSTPPSTFSNQVVDFLGNSNEYFSLNCNDPNNNNCYETNGLFKNNIYYNSLGTYMDISRLNFEYKKLKSRKKRTGESCDKDEDGNKINCKPTYKTVYYWGGSGSYPDDLSTTYNSCPLNIRNRNEKTGEYPKPKFCGQSHIQCQS